MAHLRNKVNVNGHEWSFIKIGKGTPLLLLHGIINYADFYLPVSELLKDEYEIIIPDIPAFGFTSRIQEGNTYSKIAEELFYFLKLLGYQEVDAFGTSMGGLIGLELSRNHPEIFKNLIIHSAPWRKNDVHLNEFEKFLVHELLYKFPFNISNLVREYIILKLLPTITTMEGKDVKEAFNMYRKEIMESLKLLDLQGTIEVFRSLEEVNLDKLLVPISVNTTVVIGSNDRYIEAAEEKILADKIGAKNYEILENVDHSFILDNPTRLATVIKKYTT